MELVKKKGSLSSDTLEYLLQWCEDKRHLLSPTLSSYAKGRQELWIKKRCDLRKDFCITPAYKDQYINQLGNLVLPGFDIGLLLYYPAATNITPHRDHTVFNKTAICINMTETSFFINDDPSKPYKGYRLKKGDVIEFNCKHLHSTKLLDKDRWSIIFWYLKPQYKDLIN